MTPVRGHGRLPGRGAGRRGRRRQGHGAGRSPPRPTSRPPRPQQGFEPLGVADRRLRGRRVPARQADAREARLLPEGRVRRRAGLARRRRRPTTSSRAATSPRRTPTATSPWAASGTATSVCNNKVVGFGHPMDFLGETTMSLHPANALYVQPDSLGAPFKVANFARARRHDQPGPPHRDHRLLRGGAGRRDDHLRRQLRRPQPGRQLDGHGVRRPGPQVAFFQQLANHDRVVDAIRKGSENQTWTIKGSQGGTPFTLHPQRPVHLQLRHLLRRVVRAGRPGLPAQHRGGRGRRQRRGRRRRDQRRRDVLGGAATSSWSRASGGRSTTATRPPSGRARSSSCGSCCAAATARTAKVPYSFKIPKRAAGNRGHGLPDRRQRLLLRGVLLRRVRRGRSRLSDIKGYVDGLVRNDEIAAQLFIGGGFPAAARARRCRRGRGCKGSGEIQKDATLGPADKVVSGFKRLKIVVKAPKPKH